MESESGKANMARNKICENVLQLQSKGMERKLHNRLRILSRQSSQLRQKIKFLNMEKQKADLEIKKRYFPGHDFHQDEMQLQKSMHQLILQCNQFYLNKKQRYPIRVSVKESRINSATCRSSCSSSSKRHVTVVANNCNGSNSECSNQPSANKNMDSIIIQKIKDDGNLDSGCDTSRRLPHILVPAKPKENQRTQPIGTKCTQNLAKFSVLLDSEKDNSEDDFDKLPAIQQRAADQGQSTAFGSHLEDYNSEFDTSLPNINLREFFSNTNIKTFTDMKPKTISDYHSLQKSNIKRGGLRIDQSHFQNLLELESTRLKWKINNYLLKDKSIQSKNENVETSEVDYSQVDISSRSVSEESFRVYREREASNTVPPRDVKQIKRDDNWRLTNPVGKSENFIDNLTVIMKMSMVGMNCRNVSSVPLNSAKRALRHTPTFKMQQYLKQMMAQCTKAQQFEVNKLQAEFEVTTGKTGKTEDNPKPKPEPTDQPIVNVDSELLENEEEEEEIWKNLELEEDVNRSDENVKIGEFASFMGYDIKNDN